MQSSEGYIIYRYLTVDKFPTQTQGKNQELKKEEKKEKINLIIKVWHGEDSKVSLHKSSLLKQ